MNNSTIKEVFADKINVKQNERYCEISKSIDVIIKRIAAEQKQDKREKLLSELNCLYGELEVEVCNESFIEGFKKGLAFGAEAFGDDKN